LHALLTQTPQRSLRSDLLGCYALFVGGKPLDTTYYNSSPRVRLDSTVFEIRHGDTLFWTWRLLRRLDLHGRAVDPSGRKDPFPFVWWVDSLTDSLHLSFVDGFSGAVLALAPRTASDTLYGRIEEHWDVGPPFATSQHSARGVRVTCVGT